MYWFCQCSRGTHGLAQITPQLCKIIACMWNCCSAAPGPVNQLCVYTPRAALRVTTYRSYFFNTCLCAASIYCYTCHRIYSPILLQYLLTYMQTFMNSTGWQRLHCIACDCVEAFFSVITLLTFSSYRSSVRPQSQDSCDWFPVPSTPNNCHFSPVIIIVCCEDHTENWQYEALFQWSMPMTDKPIGGE